MSGRRNSLKGRGTAHNPANRFHVHQHEYFDDGWEPARLDPARPATQLIRDNSRSIIAWNRSPDVPFDRSINPYRGCEHGCVYCFARPTHAYLDCSPGLDFETRVFYKPEAAALLEKELAAARYDCQPIALGVNTDAYQPAERGLKITRSVLEVLNACNHPVSIITKSALVERDIDLLGDMARRGLAHVMVSVTTLDRTLARSLEPRAAAPQRRLQTIRALDAAGIPVGVLVAPLIPVLNEPELESILEAVRESGACEAGYVMLRLPHEVKDLFRDWLQQHAPLQAGHIMSRIRAMRGGRDNDASFGRRMRGTGVFAELIARRFSLAHRRLGFPGMPDFDCESFCAPRREQAQYSLF